MTLPSEVDVFLIAGQSNASGAATGYPARQVLLTPEGIIYTGSNHNTIYQAPVQDELCRLCALETTEGALNNRAHGIELNLTFQYHAYFGKSCVVMKETAGATSLEVDWASGSTLRNALIDRANSLTTLLTSMGRTWNIAGVYWNQWESDTDDVGYKTLLENFVSDLRTNINGFTTAVMFVACRPSTKSAVGPANNIRTAIETAAITNYDWIDQDDLIYIQPANQRVHCDSWSQNKLAERFLLKLYPEITFS